MFPLTRQADYGLVVLSCFARAAGGTVLSAREIAETTGLTHPTVSKVLKLLAREGLLKSRRGGHGGYTLHRSASRISVVEIITALEGPIGFTECSDAVDSECDLEDPCPVRTPARRLDRIVRKALDEVSLEEMAGPAIAV